MNKKLQEKLDNLTKQPGVYLLKDLHGKVLYVGKAKNLRNRVRSYFQDSRIFDPKTTVMIQKVQDFDFIVVDNEVEALMLESNLVKQHKPRYNINLRDDKSYPYIRVTNEPVPRVFVTRKIVKDGSRYFGPYTDVKHLRYIMQSVRKIFPIRSCKYYLDDDVIAKHKIKICLDYHIQRCQGPCEGLVSMNEYQEMIWQVEKFLKGKTKDLLQEMQMKMEQNAKDLNFEGAARLRDQIHMIENYHYKSPKVIIVDDIDRDVVAFATEGDDACTVVFKIRDGKVVGRQHFYLQGVAEKPNKDILAQFLQQYYLESNYYPDQIFLPELPTDSDLIQSWLTKQAEHKIELHVPQIGEKKKLITLGQKNAKFLLDELMLQKVKRKDHIAYNVKVLQKHLNLPKLPKRIEAFDISNIQGKDAVASMVYFENGKPRKSEYRHFKIRQKTTPDDFAMMREVVYRRYKRLMNENKSLPDLILIDGGKGQLSSATQVLQELGIKNQPIVGLAKRLEEIYVPGFSEPQNIPKSSEGLKLLQQIRDESHRFAITYHRQLRKKRTLKSPLDDIPGIGPKRKDQLLRVFGSLKKISEAGVDEIVERSGLPKGVAQNIVEALKKLSNSSRKDARQ